MPKYIDLNAVEDVYAQSIWIDLRDNRKDVPPHPAPEVLDMILKLKSRLACGFGSRFVPRSMPVKNGYIQSPSKILILLLVLFCIGFFLSFVSALNELHLLQTSTHGHSLNLLGLLTMMTVSAYYSYKYFISYSRNYYYEDEEQFEVSYFGRCLTLKFADLESLVIQRNRIIIEEPMPEGLDFLDTTNIQPKQLINYLTEYFVSVAQGKNGAITVKRKK